MKNKALKKHHFWILLGLVPLFVMIGVLSVTSSAGSAIEAKEKSYNEAKKAIDAKQNPKSNAVIAAIEEEAKKVSTVKDRLWKTYWDRQKDMYVWPNSPLLKEVERMQLPFGKTIPNDRFQYEEFRKPEVYLAEYSTYDPKKGIPPLTGMADVLAPTQFNGGWQAILRHVTSNGFGTQELNSDQIWLMMEDIWVQRSMLEAIRSVNSQMAAFTRVKYEKDGQVIDDPDKKGPQDPLRRKFRSRIWEVELEVVTKNNKQEMKGRLINHTDRLQLMGLNNTMVLKVWLQPNVDKNGKLIPQIQPFEFKIGGEFLPGKGAMKADGTTPANEMDVVWTKDHEIPLAFTVSEIYKVEQVFDTRTVPVRRIESMGLGITDSRLSGSQLKAPLFIKEQAAPPPSDSGTPGGAPMGVPSVGSGNFPGGSRPGGATGSGQPSATTRSGGGTVEDRINANRKRYIDVTENVRRMPVGIAVIVDQAYMQDVLLAFANSQLKFQVTQVNWARFRGNLNNPRNEGGSLDGTGGDGPVIVGPGTGSNLGPNIGGEGAPKFGSGPMGPMGPMGPRPPMGGSSGGPPGMTTPGGPGPGTPGGQSNPYGGSGSVTVSESQLTSGLIELSIYGVVSLYEKYQAPGEAPKTDTPKVEIPKTENVKTETPKVETPKVETPKKDTGTGDKGDKKDKDSKGPKDPKDQKDPKDKTPVGTDPKTSKMRRRVR